MSGDSSPTSSDDVHSLSDVLDAIDKKVDGEDKLSVDDILGAFGSRSFGPLLVAPAIIVLSPLGAIPLVPAIFGGVIILIAGQHLFGKKSVWVPKFMRERCYSSEKWESGREKMKPVVRWIDRILKHRWPQLTRSPMDRGLALLVCLAAVLMVPLEIVPFAVMLPASAVLLLGLSLIGKDGLFAAIGSIAVVGTLWLTWIAVL